MLVKTLQKHFKPKFISKKKDQIGNNPGGGDVVVGNSNNSAMSKFRSHSHGALPSLDEFTKSVVPENPDTKIGRTKISDFVPASNAKYVCKLISHQNVFLASNPRLYIVVVAAAVIMLGCNIIQSSSCCGGSEKQHGFGYSR